MHALPFVIRALEIFDAVGVEVPETSADFVDEIVIVRDEKDRAFVALERDVERVDGFKIEVVGGLVEDQEVGLGEDELAEDEARLLAAGECLSLLLSLFAAEEHLAEDAANLFDSGLGIILVQPLDDGEAVLDLRTDVLWEVANLRLVSPGDFAGIELEFFVSQAGVVGEDGFEDCGFALAVATHETDFFTAQNIRSEVLNDFLLAVGFGESLELKDVLAAGADHIELDVGARNVGAGEVVGLEALDFFAAAGDLRGTCAGSKTRDELIELRDLFVALGVFTFKTGANLRLGHHHLVVAAGVSDDGLVIDIGSVRGDAVQEVAIVRNGNQRAIVIVQKILEPMN